MSLLRHVSGSLCGLLVPEPGTPVKAPNTSHPLARYLCTCLASLLASKFLKGGLYLLQPSLPAVPSRVSEELSWINIYLVDVCESWLQTLLFHKALEASCSMESQLLPVRSKATIYEELETANQPWQSREEAQRGGCPHLREQDLAHP